MSSALKVVAVVCVAVACGCKSREEETASRRSSEPGKPAPIEPRSAALDAGIAAARPQACEPGDHVCRDDELVSCTAAGQLGAVIQTCKDGCKMGACVDACATHDVELVYALTTDGELLSFDPHKLPGDPFREIGTVVCGLNDPNSMAVDHAGIAWVTDHQGGLFRVSILDAHCSAVGTYVGDGGDAPNSVGMGFVSNGKRTAANTAETLFVADNDRPSTLGTLDLSVERPVYHRVAAIADPGPWSPELTGTGDGRLFGYFPGEPGYVQAIEPSSGRVVGTRWTVPTTGEVRAWAFAQWGGAFYVFTTIDGNSQVHEIQRKTGKYRLVRDRLPFSILGAGVSTCAPVLERETP